MSIEDNSIHQFEINLICDFFSGVKRQGPGSPQVTIKALSFIENLSEHSMIADIGCGTGGQTMTLAQNTKGTITGIDLFPLFIDLFNKNAKELKLDNRVKGVVASMEKLPFETDSLDLIWSEGAIYNIGFEKGLREWRSLLKRGGYIAVTEASWFTTERPCEIDQFWMDAYPLIDTIPAKVAQMQSAGYMPVATFVLPEYCWTDNFFAPQTEAWKLFLERHNNSSAAVELVKYLKEEADLYSKYKDFYGYVFYIGKKI